jgi:mono/diheme cytochrome c family protein
VHNFISKLLLVVTIIFLSSILFVGCSTTLDERVGLVNDPALWVRGKSLVNGFAACGFCHGLRREVLAPLSGGQNYYDRYGSVRVPNITPAKSGIAGWTPTDFMFLFREGKGKNNQYVSKESHNGYQWLSDEDMQGLMGYLSSLPPVENVVPRREVGSLELNTIGFWESVPLVNGIVPAIKPDDMVGYGEYLVKHVARCDSCHSTSGTLFGGSEFLAGGSLVKFGEKVRVAPNLLELSSSKNNRRWKKNDFINFFKNGGERPQGKSKVDPNFCPVSFYQQAPENEMYAIATYLININKSHE